MPEFDLSKVPSEIAKLLLSRGSGTAPLDWVAYPNMLARKTLDQIEDARLFADIALRDDANPSAVRGLLYLYTGWPDEAIQYAALADGDEQAYISALVERHRMRADASKEWLQKLGTHVLFAQLYEQARQVLGKENDLRLKRFREIIEMNKTWEPYAFSDLYERARAGKLSPGGEQIVRKLQAFEFEQLFNKCFLAATGHGILKQRAISEDDEQRREREYRRQMAERREREERQRKVAEARKSKELEKNKPKEKPQAPTPSEPPKAKILCPKCGVIVHVAEELRGKPARCFKCSAVFLVPQKKPAAKPCVTSKGFGR